MFSSADAGNSKLVKKVNKSQKFVKFFKIFDSKTFTSNLIEITIYFQPGKYIRRVKLRKLRLNLQKIQPTEN